MRESGDKRIKRKKYDMAAEWYYAKGNQKFGPVESSELKRLASASVLLPEDLVWKEGLPKWVRASSIKGLFTSEAATARTTPTAVPLASLAVPSAAPSAAMVTTKDASVGRRKATFAEWYRVTLGKQWWIVQGALWVIYGFLWIPIWWLVTRHKVDTTKLALASPKADAEEARRLEELDKLERLQGNGKPFIRGEIVRLRGVSGLAKGECSLLFQQPGVVLELGTGKRVGIRYDQIKGLQIAGQGKVVESVDNAFLGGGFGLGGALQGAAQAMLLNAAVSALTRNERFECELSLEWDSGELVMMNREYLPEVVGQVLHPFIEMIP